MPHWPDDYCPLLFSLERRQDEDSLEGEIARAVFGTDRYLHVVAPVLDVDARDAAGFFAAPTPKHFYLLETFVLPGGSVWAEGEKTAAFAQETPEGGVRVLRVDTGENGEAVADPLAVICKLSGYRPERVGKGWGAGCSDIRQHDFDKAREEMSRWVDEHLDFAVTGEPRVGGPAADDPERRAWRARDLAIVVLGCMEPRLRPVYL